jgi:hypothetical protein
MTTDRTRAPNVLSALLRVNDPGLDARQLITAWQNEDMARWRAREEPLSLAVTRSEAIRLARHVNNLGADVESNSDQITELVMS